MNVLGNLNVDGRVKFSHIGQIIFSETLSTMEKVIEIYGGIKWEKIEGKFLLGASDDYPVNTEGGEATHQLTISEMPSHTHAQKCTVSDASGSFARRDLHNTVRYQLSAFPQCSSSATGGNQAHNNMPPYMSVYIWERIE